MIPGPECELIRAFLGAGAGRSADARLRNMSDPHASPEAEPGSPARPAPARHAGMTARVAFACGLVTVLLT
jgi:hypothetical protein